MVGGPGLECVVGGPSVECGVGGPRRRIDICIWGGGGVKHFNDSEKRNNWLILGNQLNVRKLKYTYTM